jgi:hypothetical protein
VLVLGAAVGALGGAAAVAACQLLDPPQNDFDSNGLTSLVFYPTSDPPSHLVSAGGYVYFVHGLSLMRVPKTGGGSAAQVLALPSPVVSLAYDGQQNIAFCDANENLTVFDTSTLQTLSVPQELPAECVTVAIDPTEIAYTHPVGGSGVDGSATGASLVYSTLPVGQVPLPVPLLVDEDAGVGLTTIAVAVANGEVFASVPPFVTVTPIVAKRPSCAVDFTGSPTQTKLIAYADPEGGTNLVVRGGGDGLKPYHVESPIDPAVDCCGVAFGGKGQCVLAPAIAGPGQGTTSDFTVQSGYLYYSAGPTIFRMSLPNDLSADDVKADIDASTAVLEFPGGSATIPDLVADDSYVFFVVGTRLLRAPLPASP